MWYCTKQNVKQLRYEEVASDQIVINKIKNNNIKESVGKPLIHIA